MAWRSVSCKLIMLKWWECRRSYKFVVLWHMPLMLKVPTVRWVCWTCVVAGEATGSDFGVWASPLIVKGVWSWKCHFQQVERCVIWQWMITIWSGLIKRSNQIPLLCCATCVTFAIPALLAEWQKQNSRHFHMTSTVQSKFAQMQIWCRASSLTS